MTVEIAVMRIEQQISSRSITPPSPWAAMTVADVMTSHVETVPLDWTMERLATFFTDKNISGAPVVDESGQLCGMVSMTDIVRQTGSGLLDLNARDDSFAEGLVDCALSDEERRNFHESLDQMVMVMDIMTPVVFRVGPDMPLVQVAEAMVKGHIHRVLVTEDKKLLGIVSSLDLLGVQNLA
ncbi:CBS domain-containing protein [Sansalvadorimonas verongulae]|uniref:CBS domain-containing protein n=1 Tax=Sansalvadorimonas verongulae TaxID=2172824 RepID=UPI0012BCE5B1|nr:CBS domain-containing protein [Sansalvadorimonas verongulae]MTI12932.1 CBS domain-containing protein [Sansalvadorimonas verongulae]